MKSMLVILFAAIGVAAAMAQTNPSQYSPPAPPATPAVPVAPQEYGGGYGGGYGSPGTAAGSGMQGMASVINARGNYNLSTSAAAMNMTQAQKQEIQNWSSFTNTYFDLRATNRRARAAERTPNLTEAQLNRIAQEGAPKPLATQQMDPVSGKIFWPDVLQDDKFQPQARRCKRHSRSGPTWAPCLGST